MTIFTTVVGTLLTITMAYLLSLPKVKYRNVINFFIYFTMLFNGGLVPSYLLISKTLGLKDNVWVLIIPSLMSAWNVFLMRNFFSGLPKELSESAYVDGANDFTINHLLPLTACIPIGCRHCFFYGQAKNRASRHTFSTGGGVNETGQYACGSLRVFDK